MKYALIFIGLSLGLLSGAQAQTSDAATRELIQKLMARIDSLEKRVGELEKANNAAALANAPATSVAPTSAAPTPQAPPPSPLAAQAVHSHDQISLSDAAQPGFPALKISGFADVDFSATDLHGPSGGFGAQTLLAPHSGFELGQLTLHMSSALSPKVSVFGEVTFSARSDAGIGGAPGFNPEVERIIVRYDANDYFKLSFGRYHTPINYWNTAYHHGQWLQTSISRPEMTQFGGSFIPVHFVGTLVEGAVPAGGLNLNYNLGLGNGRGAVISRAGDLGDINNNRAVLANVFVKPDQLYGLQVGGSVYHDSLNPLAAPAAHEWIESGHIVWQKETPEFIAEFANVRHSPIQGGVVSNSQAFYVQTAYRLPWGEKLWKPYYRFEYIHVPRSDAVFRSLVPSFSGSTVGLRYDISSFAAFKWEYRRYDRRDLPTINGAFVQTSFTF
jgi:hypothetical protein